MKNLPFLFICCACLLSDANSIGAQDPLSANAKKIFTDRQDSVVWVSAVAKLSFSAEGGKDLPFNPPDQENKVEALATIIDPSGLLVTALSQVDPARNLSGREFRMGNSMVKIEAVANLKDFKAVMADGTEIPAEIVMKDADLDLAFIRVKTASKEARGVTFPALDLKDSAPGSVMDEVVTLGRMDEVLNRAATVSRGQINTVTKKPREFLRAAGVTVGCPTFLQNGKLLGIGVTRSVKNKNPAIVVIPAADVLEIAEQARTAKPTEKMSKLNKEEK